MRGRRSGVSPGVPGAIFRLSTKGREKGALTRSDGGPTPGSAAAGRRGPGGLKEGAAQGPQGFGDATAACVHSASLHHVAHILAIVRHTCRPPPDPLLRVFHTLFFSGASRLALRSCSGVLSGRDFARSAAFRPLFDRSLGAADGTSSLRSAERHCCRCGLIVVRRCWFCSLPLLRSVGSRSGGFLRILVKVGVF